MPFDALFASESEIVPVGAIELWCVKRAPTRLDLLHELGRDFREPAHVAAVARVQDAARHAVADLPAVARHLGALAQHRARDREFLVHDRCRALLARELEARLPARDRHLARHVVGERDRLRRAVLHAEHRDGRAQAQEAHAVAALPHDLVALPAERQAVDLDHVVEHAGEDAHDLAVLVPVEARLLRERPVHEARQVHRAEQAGTVGRQRLLAAGVGGADVLAPPVVVHLVDAVDQDEAGLGEVVGRGHDDVPQPLGRERLVDLAGDQAFLVRDVALRVRPLAPDEGERIVHVVLLRVVFAQRQREGKLPLAVAAHRLDELVGHEQRQVELPEAAVLALGADEVDRVRMADVEGAHLRAAAAARRGHREAHAVVDIHEGHRAGGMRAGARDIGAARPERREFIADAATGLQREAGLVHLVEDVVHRVADRSGHGAVDRRGRRLVRERARVRHDAARRDRALAQRPEETLVQRFALRGLFDVCQGFRDARQRVVHRLVDRRAILGGQPVFPVPYVERRFLERNLFDVFVLDPDRCAHFLFAAPLVPAQLRIRRRNLTRAGASRRRLTAISRGSLTLLPA